MLALMARSTGLKLRPKPAILKGRLVLASPPGPSRKFSRGCVVLAVRAGNFGGWDQSGAHHLIETLEQLTPSLVDQLARDYGSGIP